MKSRVTARTDKAGAVRLGLLRDIKRSEER